MSTLEPELRGTSRTEPSERELLAGARVLLRDAGNVAAFDLDDQAVIAAITELSEQAAREDRTLGEHVGILYRARVARLGAPRCETCGLQRPMFVPAIGWGSLDGGAACPVCIVASQIGTRA